MKESKLLGSLMPTHPDIAPIIQAIRDKYQIPYKRPGDDCSSYLALLDTDRLLDVLS